MTQPRRLRVLVCGGRNYNEAAAWSWLERNAKDAIAECLNEAAFEIAVVIHGNARGADQGVAEWGRSEHAHVLSFPANWKKHGKAAGPIRNAKMLRVGRPDVVVALPGGRGTANMVAIAQASGIPVIEASSAIEAAVAGGAARYAAGVARYAAWDAAWDAARAGAFTQSNNQLTRMARKSSRKSK